MKTRSLLATLLTVLSFTAACDPGGPAVELRSADAAADVLPVLEEDAAWAAMPGADAESIAVAQELLACDPDYFAEVADSCVATGDCKDEILPGDELPDADCLDASAELRGSCSAGQIGTCTAGGTAACIRETWLPPGVCAAVTAASCAAACCSGRTRQCYNWN